MRINITSVFVDDQQKALRFYTEVLGFEKKNEVPLGEDYWLTVVSAEEPDGTELLRELNALQRQALVLGLHIRDRERRHRNAILYQG